MLRLLRASISTVTACLLLAGLPLSSAAADSEPDTTPPNIVFSPCRGEPPVTACQAYRILDFDGYAWDEDLAVVGARLGDQVLAEYVYNDGSGPVRYGGVSQGDVVFDAAWAVTFVVPLGVNEVTFYARDLTGNSTEQTFTLQGAELPGRPHPRASRTGVAAITVDHATAADPKGGFISAAEVRTAGRPARVLRSSPPMFVTSTVFRRLSLGWHSFRVRVRNEVGWSKPATVRAFVPRR